MNMALTVSSKSVFPTSLAVTVFKGIYSHLKNISGIIYIYIYIYCKLQEIH